jgi:hypothetical protein
MELAEPPGTIAMTLATTRCFAGMIATGLWQRPRESWDAGMRIQRKGQQQ